MAEQHSSQKPEAGHGPAESEAPPSSYLSGGSKTPLRPGERKSFLKARGWVLGLMSLILIAGLFYWMLTRHRESTDDAQIDGHLHPISARVGGTVLKVLVQDNQYVEAGTILVQIDPKDFQVAVELARANLAEAEANLHESQGMVPVTSTTTDSHLTGTEAGAGEAEAGVASAQKGVEVARARLTTAQARVRESRANAVKTDRDLERMKLLIAKEEISQQQYDAVVAASEGIRAQVEAAESLVQEADQGVRLAESQLVQQKARLARAQAEVSAARTGPQRVEISRRHAESSSAKVQQKKAALEQAELNLKYTTVVAPISGIISQRTVELGQVVQAGQPLLALVPLSLDQIWVTANFKETQLKNMHPGQQVTIQVDAYGGKKYSGRVESIAAVTGSRASLLPPENATGNYVKVVQRIPVKIVFDKDQDPQHLLRPGMSVFPTVFTK